MRCSLRVLQAGLLLAFGCGEPQPQTVAPAPETGASGGSTPALVCEAPDPSTSTEALRARIERLPGCAPFRFALADRLTRAGRCDAAEAELESLARDLATARRGRLALIRLAAGDCGDRRRRALVAPLCESILAEPDASAAAWIACGKLQEALGETARAMAHYERAHEKDPTALEAVEAPAELALRFRDFPSAANLYAALVAAAPERATAWRGLAEARHGTGDLAGAITAMERAVRLDGAAPEPRYLLAHWLRESGAIEPAVEQLRAFLVVAADDPELEPARVRARETLERWRRGR